MTQKKDLATYGGGQETGTMTTFNMEADPDLYVFTNLNKDETVKFYHPHRCEGQGYPNPTSGFKL